MRVLVAIDGGRYSEEIMEAVAHLARRGDEIHLLSVVDAHGIHSTYSSHGPAYYASRPMATPSGGLLPSQEVLRRPVETDAQAAERALEERRSHLEALVHRIPGAPGWQIHVEIDADPARTILRAARDLAVHGIAMGTRGRGGVMHVLLGSVAERVIREASVPVLVVRDGLEIPPPDIGSGT